ncbi:MAG: hypothetical protein E7254_10590 [Lachnospiraceae bacterium]|nr:hypothetical protein [Lachnospiraceae bacterium]
MFNNRRFKPIVAVLSVILVAFIVSYAPSMYGNNALATPQTSNEINSQASSANVRTLKRSLEMSDIADVYKNNSSKEEKKKTIDEMGKSVDKVKNVIKDEVKEVKDRDFSDEIKKSAEEYESKTVEELDTISDKIDNLLDSYEFLSEDEVDKGIKDIAKAIDELCNRDEMNVNKTGDEQDSSDISGIKNIEDIIKEDPSLEYYFIYIPGNLDNIPIETSPETEGQIDDTADSDSEAIADSENETETETETNQELVTETQIETETE